MTKIWFNVYRILIFLLLQKNPYIYIPKVIWCDICAVRVHTFLLCKKKIWITKKIFFPIIVIIHGVDYYCYYLITCCCLLFEWKHTETFVMMIMLLEYKLVWFCTIYIQKKIKTHRVWMKRKSEYCKSHSKSSKLKKKSCIDYRVTLWWMIISLLCSGVYVCSA